MTKTEARLKDFTHNNQQIPEYMHRGLIGYLEYRVLPGQFLQAVISNDLRYAVAQADDTNIHLLPAYVAFLYNYADSAAWGSREKMKAWIKGSAK